MDLCSYRELHHKEIFSILEEKTICSIGTSSLKDIDIIPMYYVFTTLNKTITFFLIGMDIDKKIDVNPSLNLVCIYLDNNISNFYRDAYQTIIAKGKPEIITDNEDKNYILNRFRQKFHSSFKYFTKYPNLQYMKVTIDSIAGREYNYEL